MMTIGQGMRFLPPPAGMEGGRVVSALRFTLFIPLVLLVVATVNLLY
ncbi:MAG: hypothetical protein UX68_C0042G0009 [Parcubacteria group bacterium GW2011_GWA2_46_9]|nr:MAG: hypothetical protein UX68_C0042G0009 [Parcubacteria group bacterium GW2011_GWA2_46_9]